MYYYYYYYYAILITLFRQVKTLTDGVYLQVQDAPFVSAQNHYYTWSLGVSSISIDLHGDTILS